MTLTKHESRVLQLVQPGNAVALQGMAYGKWRWVQATVTRRTAKHLGVDTDLFSRATGRLRGYAAGARHIAPLTPKYQALVKLHTAWIADQNLRQEAITTLDPDILWVLPTRRLRSLARLVKRALKGLDLRVPDTPQAWENLKEHRL